MTAIADAVGDDWSDIISLCLGNVGGRIAFGGVEDAYIDDSDSGVVWTPMRSTSTFILSIFFPIDLNVCSVWH